MVPMMGTRRRVAHDLFQRTTSKAMASPMAGADGRESGAAVESERSAQDNRLPLAHEAIAAMKAGEFTNEITPVEVTERAVDLESAKSR